MNQELPGLLELPSPFVGEPGMLRLMESADSPQEELYERVVGGTYNRPYILEDGALRYLCFSVDNVQSAMRISEPYALDLAHTQVILFQPQWKWLLCQARRLEDLLGLEFSTYVKQLKQCYDFKIGDGSLETFGDT